MLSAQYRPPPTAANAPKLAAARTAVAPQQTRPQMVPPIQTQTIGQSQGIDVSKPSSARGHLKRDNAQGQWKMSTPSEQKVLDVADWMIAMIDKAWGKVKPEEELAFKWQQRELDAIYDCMEVLCLGAKDLIKAEDYPIIRIRSPLVVLGDIHGRFDDLHFFISQLYDRTHMEMSRARSMRKAKDVRIANNFLLLGDKGEHEVAGILDVPDAMSASSANLAQFTRQKSTFNYKGADSMKTNELLFLGDFVDRGFGSLEVILYVLSLKVLSPQHVHLLRGNHETEEINEVYGFKDQCIKYFGEVKGTRAWWMINRVFDDFALAALLDGKMFCAHGGIPRLGPGGKDDRLEILDDEDLWIMLRDSPSMVEMLERPKYKRHAEIFEDLLWADPADEVFEEDLDGNGFADSLRGTSVMYGTKAIDDFLESGSFGLIMRAHQMKSCGFNVSKSGKVITVFSSSHYDTEEENYAGVAFVTPGTIRAVTRME
jgi:hypothetical protein